MEIPVPKLIQSRSPRRTSVKLRRVSEHLGMGHYTRLTEAISRMNRKPGPKPLPLQKKLSAL